MTASKQSASESNTRAGPAVQPPLVAGQLHDTPVGCEAATQDRKAARRLERPFDRDHHLLAVGRDGVGGDLGERPAVDGRRATVQEARTLQQLAHHQPEPTGFVHVGGRETAARLHVGDDRCAIGDSPEFVDVEMQTELVGDGEEMQHAVGRAARGRDAGDAVLECLRA